MYQDRLSQQCVCHTGQPSHQILFTYLSPYPNSYCREYYERAGYNESQ